MRFVILGMAVFLLLYPLFYPLSLKDVPKPPLGEGVSFYIYPGEDIGTVAKRLEDLKIIKDSAIFLTEAKKRGLSIRAGGYFLFQGMSVYDSIDVLAKRPLLERVTIPEGLTAPEIAKILVQREVLSSEREFLELVLNGKEVFKGFKYIKEIPSRGVEGYLFPETYYFPKRSSPKEIIYAMLRNFERAITPEMLAKLPKLGLSFHEVITLASIVEREGQRQDEYPIISGVFYNRLKRGMKLESCATVEYLLPEKKKRLTLTDLKIDSPYNTYLYAGLPPAPICNPGLKAIRAAFFPAEVDYLYFVSKGDGSHHFSRTYEEHLEAKDRYLGRPGQGNP